VSRAAWLPGVLLLAYALAFAGRALGLGPLAFDDHPGQLARVWHVLREGPAPWAWNDGWWAGYPELQFYPPGWFYAAAALSWLSGGMLDAPASYQTLLWITYLAPGLTAFVLLRRVLRTASGADASWCALPGAFVVLTFTGDPAGGGASGVEGGVRIGMVGARLAWALLPLLALSLLTWTRRGGRFPRTAVGLIAAITLTHPTHVPAALALVAAAVVTLRPRRRARTTAFARGRAVLSATAGVGVALALVAFWLGPLLWRLDEARALAWGRVSLATLTTAFAAVLAGLIVVALSTRRTGARLLLHALWLSVLAVAADVLIAEPLGARFLPADRVADGAWMIVLLTAGVGAGVSVHAVGRRAMGRAVRGLGAVAVTAVLIACALPANALTLWPRGADWPAYASVARGVRLDELWRALRAAPSGRALFVRSGVPLVYGTAWYRPHSHVTALTPVLGGRDIVGGTFTHGSPIAALVYRGDTRREPITRLAEQLDGVTLFGRPLEQLDAATFATYAASLRISAVVALEDDAARLPFLADNPKYRRVVAPPFLVFIADSVPPVPRSLGEGARALSIGAQGESWASTGLAYYPLWRAERDGRPVPTRRGPYGDLQVKAEDAHGAAGAAGTTTVRLTYGPGVVEIAASLLSAVTLVALAAEGVRRTRSAAREGRVAAREVRTGAETERRAERIGAVEDPRVQR
jgi:hypothetical protein